MKPETHKRKGRLYRNQDEGLEKDERETVYRYLGITYRNKKKVANPTKNFEN